MPVTIERPHVAFVVQRYGLEVCGGAELLCRYVAEHLVRYLDVDVLTTCAVEHLPWDNHYPPGETSLNGVTVRRFKLDRIREHHAFDAVSRRVFGEAHTYLDELDYLEMLGPHSTDLLSYIGMNRTTYDLFVFVCYQYFHTVFGLPMVPDRAVLVPCAHDDPGIRLDVYNPVFYMPRLLIYLTEAERAYAEWRFRRNPVPGVVIGTGIDEPAPPDAAAFRRKHGIDGPFILCVGRIEPAKGCDTLFSHFARFKDSGPRDPGPAGDLKLVLMGKAAVPIPRRPDIVHLGFVPDEDKYAGIRASSLVVLPSEYESLSIINLEAWLLGRPVLANGRCEVLRENCVRANGGLYYHSYEEFAAGLDLLLGDPALRATLGAQGRRYFEQQYSWPAVERKYLEALLGVIEGAPVGAAAEPAAALVRRPAGAPE